MGDGTCDGQDFMTGECGNDGGDCNECSVPNATLVGDGICHGGKYMTSLCNFDGGEFVPD